MPIERTNPTRSDRRETRDRAENRAPRATMLNAVERAAFGPLVQLAKDCFRFHRNNASASVDGAQSTLPLFGLIRSGASGSVGKNSERIRELDTRERHAIKRTHSSVAQLVERATVNRLVIGSSPIAGAISAQGQHPWAPGKQRASSG
jgi:hypothetical protein